MLSGQLYHSIGYRRHSRAQNHLKLPQCLIFHQQYHSQVSVVLWLLMSVAVKVIRLQLTYPPNAWSAKVIQLLHKIVRITIDKVEMPDVV